MTFGAFLLLICVWLFHNTGTFFVPPNPVAPPALWPRIILVLLGSLSVALIVINLREYLREANQRQADGTQAATVDIMAVVFEKRKVLAAMAATLTFLFSFERVGFVISCLVYYVGITYILEPTKDGKTLALRVVQAAILIALTYLVFIRGLNVQLPAGILPAHWL